MVDVTVQYNIHVNISLESLQYAYVTYVMLCHMINTVAKQINDTYCGGSSTAAIPPPPGSPPTGQEHMRHRMRVVIVM
jgi:hypothetical protein